MKAQTKYIIALCTILVCALCVRAQEKWACYRAPDMGLPSNFVKSLERVGDVLYAVTDQGICYMSLTKDSSGILDTNAVPPRFAREIRRIGDSLWIAGAGICVMDLKNGTISRLSERTTGINSPVQSITATGSEIWFGPLDAGAFLFHRGTGKWQRISTNSGLVSNRINDILAEGDSIWFATADKGLALYVRDQDKWVSFNYYDGLSNNAVNRMMKAEDRIYLCTNYGISIYDKKIEDFLNKYETNGIADNTVISCAQDGQYMWFGGMGGITRYDCRTGAIEKMTESDNVPLEFISSLAVYGNYLYVGTDGRGLARLDKGAPSACIDQVELTGKEVKIFGNAFTVRGESSYKIMYAAAAFPDMQFGKGVQLLGSNIKDGLLAIWNLDKVLDGRYVIELSVKSDRTSVNSFTYLLDTDTFDPELALDSIPACTNKKTLPISGTFREKNLAKIILTPGNVMANSDLMKKQFAGTVSLAEGKNIVRVIIYDMAGRSTELRRTVVYSEKLLDFDIPALPASTNKRTISITGMVTSVSPVKEFRIMPNAGNVTFNNTTGAFSAQLSLLADGENMFVASVRDSAGNTATRKLTIVFDNQGPDLQLTRVPLYTTDSAITISGTMNDGSVKKITLTPGNIAVAVDPATGAFVHFQKLRNGKNNFTIAAADSVGNQSQVAFCVTRDVIPPQLASLILPQTVNTPLYTLAGRVDEQNIESIIVEPGGFLAALSPDSLSYTVQLPLKNGTNRFTVTAKDRAGNTAVLRTAINANLGEGDKIILLLRNEIASMQKTVDSLQRLSGNGPAISFDEMLSIKDDLSRLASEKADLLSRLEYLKKELGSGKTPDTRGLISTIEQGSYTQISKGKIIYTARKGDTLKKIAVRFYGNAEKYLFLAQHNNLADADTLAPGTRIEIPVTGDIYIEGTGAGQ